MSVNTGRQSTAKKAWIPLAFGLLVGGPGAGAADLPAYPGMAAGALPAQGAGPELMLATDSAWDEFMSWLLDLLMIDVNDGSTELSGSVASRMLQVVNAYTVSGLVTLSREDATSLISTIDQAEQAMRNAPSSIPYLTRLQFSTTLKLMRAEAQLGL